MSKQPEQGKIVATPLKMAVHRVGVNPVFGDSVFTVEVDDDGAGPYVILNANDGSDARTGMRIDLDELEAVTDAARALVEGVQNVTDDEEGDGL